jgi:hypothetical protein
VFIFANVFCDRTVLLKLVVQFFTDEHVEQYGRFLVHGALRELQGNFGQTSFENDCLWMDAEFGKFLQASAAPQQGKTEHIHELIK